MPCEQTETVRPAVVTVKSQKDSTCSPVPHIGKSKAAARQTSAMQGIVEGGATCRIGGAAMQRYGCDACWERSPPLACPAASNLMLLRDMDTCHMTSQCTGCDVTITHAASHPQTWDANLSSVQSAYMYVQIILQYCCVFEYPCQHDQSNMISATKHGTTHASVGLLGNKCVSAIMPAQLY